MKDKILEYLQQQSTWRGIILIATALGANLSPELQDAIISIGLMLVGVMLVAKNENKPASTENNDNEKNP